MQKVEEVIAQTLLWPVNLTAKLLATGYWAGENRRLMIRRATREAECSPVTIVGGVSQGQSMMHQSDAWVKVN